MATYREAYPNSLTDGIGLISELATLGNIPWSVLSEETKQDIERAYNIRSGFKTILETLLLAPELQRAKLISAMYAEKWNKLWDIYHMDYDPLHAYVVNETGNRSTDSTAQETDKFGKVVMTLDTHEGTVSTTDDVDVSNNETVTTDYGKTKNEQTTDSGTTETYGRAEDNSTDKVYGFNSVDPSNAASSNTLNDNLETVDRDLSGTRQTTDGGQDKSIKVDTESRDRTLTETRDLDDSRTETNSGQDETSRSENRGEDWTINKTGNIGYTTPQKLIREEFDIWRTPFFAIVFEDIDAFCTISVY